MDFDFRVRKWPEGLYVPAKLLRTEEGQWPDNWEDKFQHLIQEVWNAHVDQTEQHGFSSLWALRKSLKLRIETFEDDAEKLEGQITFFQSMRQCVLTRRAKHGEDTPLAESFPLVGDQDGQNDQAKKKESERQPKQYDQIKKQLKAAKKDAKALRGELLDRLDAARTALSPEEEDVTLTVARMELEDELTGYVEDHRQQVMQAIENWWGKYRTTMQDNQADTDSQVSLESTPLSVGIFHDEDERWGWVRTRRRSTVAMKPVMHKLKAIGATSDGISPDRSRPTFALTSTWDDVFNSVKNQHEPYENQLGEITYTLDVLRFRLSIIDAISYRFEISGEVPPLSDTEADVAVKRTVLGTKRRDEHLAHALLIIEQNPSLEKFTEFDKAVDRMRVDLQLRVDSEAITRGISRGLKEEFGEAWKNKFPGFKKRILEIYEQNKERIENSEIFRDKMTLRDK